MFYMHIYSVLQAFFINNSASNLMALSYTFSAKFAPCQKQSTNNDIFTMCSVSYVLFTMTIATW